MTKGIGGVVSPTLWNNTDGTQPDKDWCDAVSEYQRNYMEKSLIKRNSEARKIAVKKATVTIYRLLFRSHDD